MIPPTSMYGCRRPNRERVLSVMCPITGSTTASQITATAIAIPSSRSSGSKPVTTMGTLYLVAIGSYSVQPITGQTWPAARNPCTRLAGDAWSAVLAGGTAFDQSLLFELVEQQDEAAGKGSQEVGQRSLRHVGMIAEIPQDPCVGRSQTERFQAFSEARGPVGADLGEEKCWTGSLGLPTHRD